MPNKLSQFWQELKRRRVIYVMVAYATGEFVILEAVEKVFGQYQDLGIMRDTYPYGRNRL